MQVFVTCPDFGLPAVSVTVGADSVVSDVLTAAAEEWDIDPEEFELSFAGDPLFETERLADRGVGTNSEVEMWRKQFRIFGKCWFVNDIKREKLLLWMRDHITENLYLDTTSFSEDGRLVVDRLLLPSEAKRISFRHSNSNSMVISQVTSIGDDFLYRCSQITSLDFSGLSGVTSIGNSFLYDCSSITSLDFSGLGGVTSIGNDFLYDCSSITSLDFSGLCSVTSTGNSFLFNCSSITSLDFSGLSGVTSIGNYFLYDCSSITSVDLSCFSGVTSIGDNFLSECSQITSLDFSGLSGVTSIGDNFLFNCSSITSLDLSGFGNVNEIGSLFLHCDSDFASKCNLESVQLPQNNDALLELLSVETVNKFLKIRRTPEQQTEK